MIVLCAKDTDKFGHLLWIDSLPDVLGNDKQACLGVVGYLMNLLGVKVGQDGYSHGTVCDSCNEGNAPT